MFAHIRLTVKKPCDKLKSKIEISELGSWNNLAQLAGCPICFAQKSLHPMAGEDDPRLSAGKNKDPSWTVEGKQVEKSTGSTQVQVMLE